MIACVVSVSNRAFALARSNFLDALSRNAFHAGYTDQEYPTEPLDKIPALQAEFELAGKLNLAKLAGWEI